MPSSTGETPACPSNHLSNPPVSVTAERLLEAPDTAERLLEAPDTAERLLEAPDTAERLLEAPDTAERLLEAPDTAERLLEAQFSLIQLRRESGLGLRRLAAELQYVKDNYRGKRPLSNSMARLGARCLSGAGLCVSRVLGGAQAGVRAQCSHRLQSSSTMKQLQRAERGERSLSRLMSRLTEQLRADCPPSLHYTHYILMQLLHALGRRCGLKEHQLNMELLCRTVFRPLRIAWIVPDACFEADASFLSKVTADVKSQIQQNHVDKAIQYMVLQGWVLEYLCRELLQTLDIVSHKFEELKVKEVEEVEEVKCFYHLTNHCGPH